MYFRQIFAILDKLGYKWSKDCYHLGFGLMHLPEGRMSTREGKIIFLEDLLNKSINLASDMIQDRIMNEEEKNQLARQVGIGAVKYMVLQVDPVKEITFNWDRALDFSGNSAPYIQYAFARTSSILDKVSNNEHNFDGKDLTLPEEQQVLCTLSQFPDLVKKAAESYKPNIIANYAYCVAKDFSDLYSKVRVIGSNEENSRLALAESVRTTIKNSLGLLGIECPYSM
jgi:arginyl-tRNA synthetase